MLKIAAVMTVVGALCGASAFASNDSGPVIMPVSEVTAPKAVAPAPKLAIVKPAQPVRDTVAEREAEDNATVSLGIGPYVRPNLGFVFTR